MSKTVESVRIAAYVTVLDEVEVVGHAIDHLERIGVDAITVCDYGSADGTAELLEGYARQGRVRVISPPSGISLDELLEFHLRQVRSLDAGWALLLDADEFWLPSSGNIKDCISLVDNDLIVVPRYNIPLTVSGPLAPGASLLESYEKILLVARPIEDFWEHRERYKDVSWIFSKVAPKVMVRPTSVRSLGNGFHDAVLLNPESMKRVVSTEVIVAHLPFSSQERFRRKIRNIGLLLGGPDSNSKMQGGWHWREWHARTDDEIRAVFESAMIDARTLALLKYSGMIQTAATLLRGNKSRRTA